MDKPDHLYRFPCMYPWIGPKYECSERRLAIVAESHYLPRNVTCLNYCPSIWYAAWQEDVPNIKDAHSWMNTDCCVRNRHKIDNHNPTYQKIDEVLKLHLLSFEEIAFFNYVFRPTEDRKDRKGYSRPFFDILDKDRDVSSEIMEWFIRKYRPKAIVIASTIVMKWTCVRCDLAAHPKIKSCLTNHPMARKDNRFSEDVRKFLNDPSYRGSRANSPWCLNECQQARCRSYPRRSGKPAS